MYLTSVEARERLRVSRATFERLIREGDLKASRIGRGRGQFRVDEADLQDYMDRAAARAKAEAST